MPCPNDMSWDKMFENIKTKCSSGPYFFIFDKVFFFSMKYTALQCTALCKLVQFDCPEFSLSDDRTANSSF